MRDNQDADKVAASKRLKRARFQLPASETFRASFESAIEAFLPAVVARVQIDRDAYTETYYDEVFIDLEAFMTYGALPELHFDNWDNISEMFDPSMGGCTPIDAVQNYFEMRAARRALCKKLKEFCALVEADDKARDEREAKH